MSADPNKKTARTFQCRDALWEAFEQIAQELECSVDYLINEAMKQYAKQRSHGATRTPFPGPRGEASASIPPQGPGSASPRPPPPYRHQGASGAPPPGGMSGGALPPPPGRVSVPGRPLPSMPPAQAARAVPPPPVSAPAPHTTRPTVRAIPPIVGGPPPIPGTSPPRSFGPPPLAGLGPPSRSVVPPPPGASQRPPAREPTNGVPLASSQPGSLTLIYNGERFPITKERFVIGRGKQSSDLTLKDPNVSRQHALVEFQNGTYFMVDMGSTNGVAYNGQRIARRAIGEGDVFRICDHDLRFTYH